MARVCFLLRSSCIKLMGAGHVCLAICCSGCGHLSWWVGLSVIMGGVWLYYCTLLISSFPTAGSSGDDLIQDDSKLS